MSKEISRRAFLGLVSIAAAGGAAALASGEIKISPITPEPDTKDLLDLLKNDKYLALYKAASRNLPYKIYPEENPSNAKKITKDWLDANSPFFTDPGNSEVVVNQAKTLLSEMQNSQIDPFKNMVSVLIDENGSIRSDIQIKCLSFSKDQEFAKYQDKTNQRKINGIPIDKIPILTRSKTSNDGTVSFEIIFNQDFLNVGENTEKTKLKVIQMLSHEAAHVLFIKNLILKINECYKSGDQLVGIDKYGKVINDVKAGTNSELNNLMEAYAHWVTAIGYENLLNINGQNITGLAQEMKNVRDNAFCFGDQKTWYGDPWVSYISDAYKNLQTSN